MQPQMNNDDIIQAVRNYTPPPPVDLSGYIPYDLAKIPSIAHQTMKACSKIKTTEKKLRHLALACEKIEQIINNSLSVFHLLQREERIDDPQPFWDQYEQAQNFKKRLEIRIRDYEFREPKKITAEIIEKQNNIAQAAIQETPPRAKFADDNMNIYQAADYLKISRSSIYHLSREGKIPRIKIGSRLVFQKTDLDKWLESKKK
jgi:excisionase family DNA binding protein